MTAGDTVLLLGGDLHIQRPDPTSMLALMADTLQGADILFGNLESVLSESVPAQPGADHLRSDPEMLDAYVAAGFAVLGLGNHGCMSCGPEALLRTLELLDDAGIAHAGAGRTLSAARTPAIVERNGVRVAFLAYNCIGERRLAATDATPGVAHVRARTAYEFDGLATVPGATPRARTTAYPEDLAMVAEDVRRARSQADIVVTSWHWGLGARSNGANAGRVMDYQRELAHAAIDSGCDLVVGHHVHVLSAIETYRGKAIFYSLGNFAFDYFADPDHFKSVYAGTRPTDRVSFGLARCVMRDRAIQEVSLLPIRIPIQDPRPRLADASEAKDIQEQLRFLSEGYGTGFRPRGAELLITEASAAPAFG